ncbi:hypothetical protein CDD80_6655 [Ophiocordyceps camponoti-rufipedis]|uniref:Large ribosomal subunit protein uL15/eL18 domain-containing protein n=1 Tax=Ophiocordyceps camponoti-rufipedis TaxID=2004952 RepID=A0A2C5XEJ3_9HYPO|nr:hypothetical protein CDD80_6655 [Ophiocordyceps camponoti-rufipedis]
MSEVNLDRLQEWIDNGRIDASKPITPKEMIVSKLSGSIKDGIKILSRGVTQLRQPIQITASRASAGAIAAIEAAGGSIVTRYYTKTALRRLVRGESQHSDEPLPQGGQFVEGIVTGARRAGFPYRLPDATRRRDIEYYRDVAHRGYLSGMLKKGETPSLYWRVPLEETETKKRGVPKKVQVKKKETVETTMW